MSFFISTCGKVLHKVTVASPVVWTRWMALKNYY